MEKGVIMKKTIKILIGLLILLAMALMVFMFAEEVVVLKQNIYTFVSELGSQPKREAPKNFEETYASFPPFAHEEDAWYQDTELIYHAGGGIDGLGYTNSKEALEWAVQHGNVIEIDFLFTEDKVLVCAHEWINVTDSGETLTLSEFESVKIYGKYTTMSAKDLLDFMDRHEDIYIVIDTKEPDAVSVVQELLRLAENRAELVERLIIQLYEEESKQRFLDLYPFPNENFLFTCYKFGYDPKAVLSVCMEENISVVTVPHGVWNAEAIRLFKEKGIVLFEHTVNRPDWALESKEKGIDGFYTDFLTMP